MELPVSLVCIRCRGTFGSVLNPGKSIAENPPDWDIKAICDDCIEQLSREKGITPYTLEDWECLLEGIL
jgi:hypothetical protein